MVRDQNEEHMTSQKWLARSGALLAVIALPIAAATQALAASADAEETYRDIEKTLGSVPQFFREFPEFAIGPAWAEMKGLQLNPRTQLSSKTKELVGLAVAAQIPCTYCVYFHTETAKALGATDDEIDHALAEAALTRHWSTILNGADLNEADFRSEMKRVVAYMKKQPPQPARMPVPVADAKAALKDIEKTFGFVPTFMKHVPEEALVGAWNEMKMVEGNPKAPLDEKTVSLIGLAVAAQVPCKFCVIADQEFATLGGATERQKMETVAIAAIVRHWSTFLNGAQIDERRFRNDVDNIVIAMKKNDSERPQGR